MLLMFYLYFCKQLASQIWSVFSELDCGVKGKIERDRRTSLLFGQQYLNEVVGKGTKKDGKKSSGQARTKGMRWRVGHSGESFVSLERKSILCRMEITDLGWHWGWWGGHCRGIRQERGELKMSVGSSYRKQGRTEGVACEGETERLELEIVSRNNL